MTTATPQRQAPLPSTLSVGWQRGGIEAKEFVRDREAMVFTFALPLLLLLIFGSVFQEDIAPGVTFAQYFVAGMIASGLVYAGFQNLAITIPMERDDGTLKRLRGTPMPAASYFVGKSLLILLTLVVQIVLLLLIGVLLYDVSLPSTPGRWFAFAWISILGIITCTLLGIAFSSLPKSGRGAPALVSPVVLVLQFTSGVFFVYSELPSWMQQLAALFPLKWLCQGMRYVFLPDSFASQEPAGAWELPKVALVLVIWAVIGLVLCLRTFRWQRRDAG